MSQKKMCLHRSLCLGHWISAFWFPFLSETFPFMLLCHSFQCNCFPEQYGDKPSNVKNVFICQDDKCHQEAIDKFIDKYLLILIMNNSLIFHATIWILGTILDTQVKIYPSDIFKIYILTVIEAQALYQGLCLRNKTTITL